MSATIDAPGAAHREIHVLIVVECPRADEELREKLRCPSHAPIRCEHADDLASARRALARRRFDLVIAATAGRDPAAVVDALVNDGEPSATLLVVGESESDVARALDAGAAIAYERARLPAGILSYILDLGVDPSEPTTMELPLSPR